MIDLGAVTRGVDFLPNLVGSTSIPFASLSSHLPFLLPLSLPFPCPSIPNPSSLPLPAKSSYRGFGEAL